MDHTDYHADDCRPAALPPEDWSDEDWSFYEEVCREGRAAARERHLAWLDTYPDAGDDLPW